jgi:hypothetical protein
MRSHSHVKGVFRSKHARTLKYKFKYYKVTLTFGGILLSEELKKQIVTSLRVDSHLWKEAKVQAIRNDITLTALVEEAINLWLQEKINEKKPSQKK